MVENPREMLNDFVSGLGNFSELEATKGATEGFMGLLGNVYEDNALDTKTKELISIGIAVYCRCQYCIVYHTFKAFEAGATRAEILQAATVSVAFGGGPAMTYATTLLQKCLDEFEKDFE